MKAILLGAGLGTRLRPLTLDVPKCLLPIAGRPLLEIWLENLSRIGVDDVLLNTHYLAAKVADFAAERAAPPRLRLAHEPTLLGSAGTLVANRRFVEGERHFLVLYADNLTTFDLLELVRDHEASGTIATLGLFHSRRPRDCGIVELDHAGVMTGFVEKPREPKSDLANAGLYVFSPAVFDLIGPDVNDIGYDLLPRLVGKARGLEMRGYFRDIGTLDDYENAQKEWQG